MLLGGFSSALAEVTARPTSPDVIAGEPLSGFPDAITVSRPAADSIAKSVAAVSPAFDVDAGGEYVA